MALIGLSIDLPASIDDVWRHACTPKLLHYVTKGIMSFTPIDPPVWPDVWAAHEYEAQMRFGGFLPVGKQILGMEYPPADGGKRFLRDNGHSASIARWDHLITLEPIDATHTRYTDCLDLDAGFRTPLIAAFAKQFYGYRQKRWRKLIDNEFDYQS